MKKLSIIMIVLFSFSGYAQENHVKKNWHRKELKNDRQELTSEQIAELSSRKMTLDLDLNESQQNKVQKILLERTRKRQEREKTRESHRGLSQKDQFVARIARLDDKIALKKSMKSILNDMQYEKWGKRHNLLKKRRGRHHKKRSIHSEKC